MKHLVLICLLALMLAAATTASLAQSTPMTTISGQVTLDSGKPAVGYSLVAYSINYVSPTPAGEAITDATGHYVMQIDTHLAPSLFAGTPNLPDDTQFTVTMTVPSKLYGDPAEQTVTLDQGKPASGINFQVVTGPKVTIHVRDALTGKPVPDMTAQYSTNFGSNQYQVAGVTDAQGNLVFRVPLLQFNLQLIPPGGSSPTIQAAPGSQFWDQVWSQTLQDITWTVKTYPQSLPAQTLWHGVVLDQAGRPAADATVDIIRDSGETVLKTNKRGTFSAMLPPLNPNEAYDSPAYVQLRVAVQANKGDQTALLVPTPDEIWDGMTLRLTHAPWASFTGTVVDQNGHPEAGVPISCDGGLAAAATGFTRSEGTTDAHGHFFIPNLPAGKYRISFGGGPFGSTSVPLSDPSTPYTGSQISLAAGEQKNLGNVLVPPADQIVAGQIVYANGQPAQNVIAYLRGAHINQEVNEDTTGHFRIYYVVQEPLTLDIYHSTNGGASTGPGSPDLAMKIPVQAGQQDIHVVLSDQFQPPAPIAAPSPPNALPSPPPPTGPMSVYAASNDVLIDGLMVRYRPISPLGDPAKTGFHVKLSLATSLFPRPGQAAFWQGDMADMDGMQLTVQQGLGTLQDRTGHILWSGKMLQPNFFPPQTVSYHIIIDPGPPKQLTIKDGKNKVLWSGAVYTQGAAYITQDGYIAAIGPNGKIVWQQPMAPGSITMTTLTKHPQSQEKMPPWPPLLDGQVRIMAARDTAVFRDAEGHELYRGKVSVLTTQSSLQNKHYPAWYVTAAAPATILPYFVHNLRGTVTYTIYNATGTQIATGYWKQG